MNYFTTVEQFFLSLKDSGLALSASDYQLISKWEEQRVPVDCICRAIESSFSKFDVQIRRRRGNISLTQIQSIIEEEIQSEIHKL
mgnify:CR=1 FL=1